MTVIKALGVALVGLLGLALGVELWFALSWRMQHDTPLIHYQAFLIDRHGFVPYRDLFETSMVGTLLFHVAIGKVFGYGDVGFRIANYLFVALVLGSTWLGLRRFGNVVALAAAFHFGLLYFGQGPFMSLQRDCVGILPLIAAVIVATANNAKSSVVGVLCGLAFLLKPHLALALPVLLLHIAFDRTRGGETGARFGRQLARSILLAAAGFAVAVIPAFVWLWWKGGLASFFELYSSYLPLHLQMTGRHETVGGMDRLAYLAESYFEGVWIFALPIAAGLLVALTDPELDRRRRRVVVTLGVLAFVYSVYPVLAGQFWRYHWMPFNYFAVLCTALSLTAVTSVRRRRWIGAAAISVFVASVVLTVPWNDQLRRQLDGLPPAPPKQGRPDRIAEFLEQAHLGEDDRVQPLDWTGGAVHGMLRAEAVVATPFICDYHFYHHVSQPYIQEIRRRFIAQLEEVKPRFVIDVKNKPRPTGDDTSRSFPALEQLLRRDYRIVQRGGGVQILERKR